MQFSSKKPPTPTEKFEVMLRFLKVIIIRMEPQHQPIPSIKVYSYMMLML